MPQRRPAPTATFLVYEVNVADLVQYDVPEDVPAWHWVQDHASFAHVDNGAAPGVWEFMVHNGVLREHLDDVPTLIRPAVDQALAAGASSVLFHQG